MKLTQDTHSADGQHIAYYDHEKVIINKTEYRQNCIIFPDEVMAWPHNHVKKINGKDFDEIIARQPELIILGTGQQLIFPNPDTIAHIQAKHIGLEVMDLGAACRSYNLLHGEQRYIAAIMMFDGN